MRYVSAYLLAVLGGNPNPTVASIEKILASVGIECDQQRAQSVIDAGKGRGVEDIVAQGMQLIQQTCTTGTPIAVDDTNTPSPPPTEKPAPSALVPVAPENDDPMDDMVRACIHLQVLAFSHYTFLFLAVQLI